MSNRQKIKKAAPLRDELHRRPAPAEAWVEQQRTLRTPHHGVNAYTCDVCGLNTMTIDVDPGVTPMLLACRRTPNCTGTGTSAGYPEGPVPAEMLEHLTWEWSTPTEVEFRKLSPAVQDHVERGGLVLRPRGDRPSAYAGVAAAPSWSAPDTDVLADIGSARDRMEEQRYEPTPCPHGYGAIIHCPICTGVDS